MEEEYENESGGVTLGYIFRTIFSQKWLALIVAAVITVVGALGIYFYGKGKRTYSVAFVLQLPSSGDASSTTYVYPDGESFYFTDLVSVENLKKVASREEFKHIDIDNMVKNGDISIKRTVDRIDEESKEGVFDLNYTVTVKASYFTDEDEARDFIETLTLSPREYIAEMEINYDQSLTTSKSAITYEEQLNLLKSQATYIQSQYNALVGSYGREFVLSDGTTLAQRKDEVDTYVSKNLFGSLISIAKENGYVKTNTEARLKYQGDLDSVNRQLQEAENTLEGLKDVSSSSVIYDKIIELNREISNLNIQRDILKRYIAAYDAQTKTPAEFEAEITNIETAVSKFTADIKPVASEVYKKVTRINYLNTKVIELEGGFSIIVSGLIGLVAGLLVAAIAAYIVGWSKQKKTLKAEGVTMPYVGEAQLQLAATDENEASDEDKKE